ncbi:MAG: YtxH domain-containing protein [Dehalococcoidia bacterium]|nr:MAG: YtxH domain-containing protein [Dehalococcoidia bacterium]
MNNIGGGKEMSNNSPGSLMSGLLTGVAIGISLGLLYAPRTGREIRAELKHRALELKDRAEELGEDLLEQVEELGDDVRTRIKKATVAA